MRKSLKLALGLVLAASASTRTADVVYGQNTGAAAAVPSNGTTYYQENGVTYRETRYTVGHPVVETQLQPQQHTVYSTVPTTTSRDMVRTYHVPVTEYRSETYMKNRWNPFSTPYMAERIKPVTYWQMRTEVTQVPVTQHVVVPQQVTVHVPVTTHRVVNEEHISRVAVGGQGLPSAAPGAPQTAIAIAPPPQSSAVTVGGISNLQQDPPRVGSNYQWRPATSLR
jgi:hypothetical protein